MDIKLTYNQPPATFKPQLKITGSKSVTNRLLLLQALYPNIIIRNGSISDDSEVMIQALQNQPPINSHPQLINIHHAGTAMRFLTAFFAIQEGKEVILTGSSRMKERPIKILVDALNQLGAEITYEENEGFPPIRIIGKKLAQNKVSLPANVSSQYISALLLIAPKLKNGLELTLEGEMTSVPYVKMTLTLLNNLGIQTTFNHHKIIISSKDKVKNTEFSVESDWSSASYFYSIVALSPRNTKIELATYHKNSLQGDFKLIEIYKNLGVETNFTETGISLEKVNGVHQSIKLNLKDCPDIAQTIAVTCFGLGVGCNLEGLHTLRIKETNRLEALRVEFSKLGAMIITTDTGLIIAPSTKINENISINTYQDHRMAMAFTPLAIKVPIIIKDSEVVSKSYPSFWEDLESIGFQIS
ncbi:MAG TPA: 3-phosphoshikimate 1-carboxyvinyltransferase [Flavobacterium sp.]|jgi:3-phosphoshikimate 1-carboxyvinyltransferase|nr:3-phosphoshikimate 1-carboxyvinyltransferase [Flavobacterium sp.]HRZ31919.1 3-phosphoshikimate 1-carboxyvinyltransferase [Flavobacterium sp.]HRZ75291.1 3-phosphoshikimate 1-carboxyvinyltransferase [Flavobacterium sp.]